LGNQDEKLSDDKGIEACNRYSDVRSFMEGMIDDKDFLEYHDRVEMVASFCEQANLREYDPKPGQKALDGNMWHYLTTGILVVSWPIRRDTAGHT